MWRAATPRQRMLGAAGIIVALAITFMLGTLMPMHVPEMPSEALQHAYGGSRAAKEVRSQGLNICSRDYQQMLANEQEKRRPEATCAAQTPLYTISHPKSGRTWMRCLVAEAYACHNKLKDNVDLVDIKDYAANVLAFTHGEPYHPFSSTPWDLTHGFAEDKPHEREHGLLLVRDPRDVIVSSYYERLYRDPKRWLMPWVSMSDYLRHDKGSLKTLLMFLNLWSSVVEKPGWTVLRYEDLKQCPETALQHILNERLCLGVSQQCVESAVQWCDFSQLQKRADKATSDGGGKIWKPTDKRNPNSRKVRKGKVGGYREDLSESDIAYVERTIQKHLVGGRIFGYAQPPRGAAVSAGGDADQGGEK